MVEERFWGHEEAVRENVSVEDHGGRWEIYRELEVGDVRFVRLLVGGEFDLQYDDDGRSIVTLLKLRFSPQIPSAIENA